MARFVGIVLVMMMVLVLVGFVLAHFGIVVLLVLAVVSPRPSPAPARCLSTSTSRPSAPTPGWHSPSGGGGSRSPCASGSRLVWQLGVALDGQGLGVLLLGCVGIAVWRSPVLRRRLAVDAFGPGHPALVQPGSSSPAR